MLFFFTPAGGEQVFIQGGDEAVPGQSPERWDADRSARMQQVVERLKLNTEVLPEG
jgi:hypothetical protein